MAALKNLLGDKVQGKCGGEVDVETFSNKVVGLYFSAHWCPPCRMFTPKLAEFYKKIHESKNLEIVFVSCDRDDKSFEEYWGSQPWLAMHFDDKYKNREDLMSEFGVRGIPALIFLDGATGKVLSQDGRSLVDKDPEGAKFPWW